MTLNQGLKTVITTCVTPTFSKLLNCTRVLGSTVLQVQAKFGNFKVDYGSKNKKAGNNQKVLKQKLPMSAHILVHIQGSAQKFLSGGLKLS